MWRSENGKGTGIYRPTTQADLWIITLHKHEDEDNNTSIRMGKIEFGGTRGNLKKN